MGTFTMCPAWTHRAHCDQIDGHFLKELNMSSLADGWAHCLKNHNVITMYTLGSDPLPPVNVGLKKRDTQLTCQEDVMDRCLALNCIEVDELPVKVTLAILDAFSRVLTSTFLDRAT